MPDFRKKHPIRNPNIANGRPHTAYRESLKQDFNGRCGYTDCRDIWWGVKFQVDHFAPQNPDTGNVTKDRAFKNLERTYSNLVYACPQVNNAKGNLWVTDDPSQSFKDNTGLLDPCDYDYNVYFARTETGRIIPKDGNAIADFMIDKLKLYLFRYELYWRIDELYECQKRLLAVKKRLDIKSPYIPEINALIAELSEEFSKYFEYIGVNHNEIV